MALRDWFSPQTALQLAIERGVQPGTNLAEELQNLDEYKIKSAGDAKAICQVLDRLAADGRVGGEGAFRAVVGLFQDVESVDCPAFPILAEEGNELLAQIVQRALSNRSPTEQDDDLLFTLKILGLYCSRSGTNAVLQGARLPLRPNSFLWSVILGAYGPGHPERIRLFEELRNPLPQDFIAMSLLDCANSAKREGATDPHPFDSAAGVMQLERWLDDKDGDHSSCAVSAASALPFLTNADRDHLLTLALDHSNKEVQMEGAWAAAKLGREAGIRWLSRSCLDPALSSRAKQYLEELGVPEAVPAEAESPDFRAQAEFAQWLAHPSELGRPPDELEIVDQRELLWPPDREPKPFWLIKYRAKAATETEPDHVDVGLVGSVTFCLFSYKNAQRPPEDVYALHCYWEMTIGGLITEADVDDQSTEYDQMFRQYQPGGVQGRIVAVAEFSSQLEYPQSLIALAEGTRQGESGCVVLDGPRSQWYPAAEMPADVDEKTVLMVHVGRVLLGFHGAPDRRQ